MGALGIGRKERSISRESAATNGVPGTVSLYCDLAISSQLVGSVLVP